MFAFDVIPSEARDLQWNAVPTVAPEDSSPRQLRRLGMTITITLTHYTFVHELDDHGNDPARR